MIKNITNFLIIFFIFQQLQSQISQFDQNGVKPFCDETLHMLGLVCLYCNIYNVVYKYETQITYALQ